MEQLLFDLNSVKSALAKAGFEKFYETKNGGITVRDSDAVQVNVSVHDGKVKIKPSYPTTIILILIIVTVALVLGGAYYDIPYFLIVGLIALQILSFALLFPKIKSLKQRVEQALN